MAQDSSKAGVFRYLRVSTLEEELEQMTHLTPSKQGRELIAKPDDYNAENFARSVMICDVHKRFASASFPSELRLQVMKAGVPYNTTCELSQNKSMKTVRGLIAEAYDLLLCSPQQRHSYERDPWADLESAEVIRRRAEQAFWETVIFKFGIEVAVPTPCYYGWSCGLSYLSKTIGAKIRHLHLVTLVEGLYGPHGEQYPLAVALLQNNIENIDMLKLHFPNLKACVLTLDLRVHPVDVFTPQHYPPFDQSFLLWAGRTETDISHVKTYVATEVASLFDTFVAKGPGRSQFVRIRYMCASQPLHADGEKLYEPFCYGPVVKVDCEKMANESPDEYFGAQLLKHAHQFARADPWSVSKG
jgi:hypothetical protein